MIEQKELERRQVKRLAKRMFHDFELYAKEKGYPKDGFDYGLAREAYVTGYRDGFALEEGDAQWPCK